MADLRLTGVDLVPTMIEKARARDQTYTELLQADLSERLPFSGERFSLVVCGGVLTWIQNADHVLREFVRVTQPGGAIIVTHRSDSFEQFGYDKAQESLAASGVVEVEFEGEWLPYLPQHRRFTEENLCVKFYIFKKRVPELQRLLFHFSYFSPRKSKL